MKYFLHASSVETVKTLYRSLAMQHHPDRGGDTATMAEINRQYEAALRRLDGSETDGRTYHYDEAKENDLIDKLRVLLSLPGIDIDLVGRWLWISGDTRQVKDQLKAAGCRWSADRQLWYWRPAEDARRFRGNAASFADICRTYGASRIIPKHERLSA